MLVYVPPTAQVICIWGLYLGFTGGIAFPLHHGGIFALKGSALSRPSLPTMTECVKRVMVVYTRSFDLFYVLICCFTSTVSRWCHIVTVSYLTKLFLGKSPVGR